jgi:DNA polymerase III epsilon subunit
MKERTGINNCDNKRGKRHVIFDVETTGLFVERGHRIIEIGAVAVNGGVMGEEFSSLIFTDKTITKKAQKVHGITAAMLAGQPKPEEALEAFRDFIGDSTLVAHNAVFDVWFLRYEYWRLGHTLINRHKCTLRMSRKLYPGLPNYKLETVARHLDIAVDETRRHCALEDARLAAKVWIEIRRK